MTTALLLTVYTGFVVVFSLLSFLALYQLSQFGYVGDASKQAIVLYIVIAASIILAGFLLIIFVA